VIFREFASVTGGRLGGVRSAPSRSFQAIDWGSPVDEGVGAPSKMIDVSKIKDAAEILIYHVRSVGMGSRRLRVDGQTGGVSLTWHDAIIVGSACVLTLPYLYK
jgi:hypothetical protein